MRISYLEPDRLILLNAALETPRLRLEPLVASHADALFDVLSDPATRRWFPPTKSRDVEELRERWRALAGSG